MTTIYLIRHCSATGQAPDAPLTEAGERQALALRDFFQDVPVTRIISSDYERAVASITPFATASELSIETEPKLRERTLSLEPREDWLELLRHSFQDNSFALPGAESGQDATARILDVVDRTDGPTILVTHGNLLALLLQHVDNCYSVKRVWSDPACG
ncbi:histidine phosphatase family protein [Exiguobacterium sp.]|uniref:histidine phosphatase family protein n=1 Tax=Exiguobacterium sp. TaxID=44751 RepID=UPI00263AC189|nr:histidine phosphatase family protein [Exiguobacterium sp.]MCC5893331.1 histidine phosphatase family protein [Exiguobacterium sp.]